MAKQPTRPAPSVVDPPKAFRLDRTRKVGRHALTDVFGGLESLPRFDRYPGSPASRRKVLKEAAVEVVRGDVWMYVAPFETPPFADDVGWKPVVSASDCIVVGRKHLAESPALTVYLDAIHEICHLFQRRAGRDLWDMPNGYAESPTEVEAYRLAVDEARRLGATDAYLREYLEVEWIDAKEHAVLLRNVGVPGK